MLTVGLGLLGASVVVLLFQDEAPNVLEGFGFGAALLAMFMRVGGGIFTKAADVGADLVGKVEQGIPEDDPRNAATIADNVGDNVGDCAGMAADLFESYAVTLVAALILGSQAFGDKGLVFPLLIPAIGALTAVAGVYLCKPRAGENGLVTINRAFYISAAIGAVASVALSFIYLPTSFPELDNISIEADGNPALIASIARADRHRARLDHPQPHGLLHRHRLPPRQGRRAHVADRCGDRDPVGPRGRLRVRGLHDARDRAAVFGAFLVGGGSIPVALFAVALAGCGLLTTVGVIVAMDTFGPVSDNAQGIAEMSGDVDEKGAQILTELDAVGNTTKAITKGIAIATAVLAASALFGSYTNALGESLQEVKLTEAPSDLTQLAFSFDISFPNVLVGALLGAAAVFLFFGPRHQRRRPRRRRGGLRGASPAPRDPRDHGGHRPSGVRQGRRHRHQGLAARARHAGHPGDPARRSRWASASASGHSPASWPARSPPAP